MPETIIIESIPKVTGNIAEGIALLPGISANGYLYEKNIIKTAQNVGTQLPVFWEHDERQSIGSVTFSLDESIPLLKYRLVLNSENHRLVEGLHRVSIDAGAKLTQRCYPHNCYKVVEMLVLRGISVTADPSVIGSSLSVVYEKLDNWNSYEGKCEDCRNRSLTQTNTQTELMTEETSTITDSTKLEEVKETKVEEVKEEVKVETKPDVVPNSDWMANKDEINARLKEHKEMLDDLKSRINNPTQFKELEAMMEASKNPYRVAKISPEAGQFKNEDLKKISEEMLGSIKKYGSYSWNIDLDPEIALNTAKVQEAITFSTSQSNVVSDGSPVYLLPGGKHIKSIRNLVAFSEIPAGADTINKAKGNIPNNQSITEQSSITYNGHTITTIQLTADTVTGNGEAIKMADVEDSPFEIMSYLTQAARAEVLEAEATLAFTTAAAAATPNLWINANSGATITHTDIASMTMEPVSLLVALQDLETSGYYPEFGEAYCALHPKAMRELRGSTNLTTLVQQGDANITKTGRLTHLYGIELYPTTAVDTDNNTTSDVYNNVVGLKGSTFWLASKREIELTMLKKANPLGVDFTWSQRKNATCFDPASFIRISSAQ